ncbi:phosphoribosylformylglycinamidine synthase [Trueperella pyogenes]|uniref:phosphoribosylformylglycinamidine synthase n=1 Tax=Trueperella pyogenes TaxID=1661 RepID=UPI00345D2EEC
MHRIYVEKKPAERLEAAALASELRDVLGLSIGQVRVLNRYDVDGLTDAEFAAVVPTILSEPQVDITFASLDDAGLAGHVFAVEPLPGQYDQRADSAAQCIQIQLGGQRPVVRAAKIYTIEADAAALEAIKNYVINPVEAREGTLARPESLAGETTAPDGVVNVELVGKDDAELAQLRVELGLAMSEADLAMLRDYFATEGRQPTLTEVKVVDTYWSDHCRHTTFMTVLDEVTFDNPQVEQSYQTYIDARRELRRSKPITLMDMAAIGAKLLKARGKLAHVDESEEINACTIKVDAKVGGKAEPWLVLFKNETHNHPTEIEPFGGAATCIGGAIRDPLSGRGYVHGAMRLTGSGDPRTPLSETLAGKLPQRAIAQRAAAGYSSYGNQIGLATGIVDEIYHPGYVAKHMELGAVVAAAPAEQVRREAPQPGDVVLLVGGATGRDGIGGATGSSKTHTVESLTSAGAEVQKGNAPEERKLQRLFRNPEAALLIKRCNDFGAGGVAVAVGELTDGLDINLDAVPKKYEGLDGTEIAISESQERMAVVVEASDAERFIELAATENLEATVIATVSDSGRLRMYWRGEPVVDIARSFLDTNGAEQRANAKVAASGDWAATRLGHSGTFAERLAEVACDLNVASKKGLSERFDSTVGAGTVLMPFGGSLQATPIQAMAHRLPTSEETDAVSVMSWGYNPYLSEASPFHGAYLAVVESVAKLVATGAKSDDVYLSFQEYFEGLGQEAARWGKPVAALLGALEAQIGLGAGAIGGKDSMSGSFNELSVPPTLVSFALAVDEAGNMVPNQFKAAGHRVSLLRPHISDGGALAGLPEPESLQAVFAQVTELLRSGAVVSAYTPGRGGVAEAVMKMAAGEGFGFEFAGEVGLDSLFDYAYGAFVLEWAEGAEVAGQVLGTVSAEGFTWRGESVPSAEIFTLNASVLDDVYPRHVDQPGQIPAGLRGAPASPGAEQVCGGTRRNPKVPQGEKVRRAGGVVKALIPVFPGTNCEYDTARAVEAAGAKAHVFVVKNRSEDDIARSVEEFAGVLADSQMLIIPGGFSGGDEPDGSAKFITSFLRNEALVAGVGELLGGDGLILGICNGFQALVKLGLVPYGEIVEPRADSPTLTFNRIGRHQSGIVRVRVENNSSPWLAGVKPGEVYSVPISHGEGRFHILDADLQALIDAGQIATQYVDLAGNATMDITANPNGSDAAIEGITSPDGHVFGKMGHAERIGAGLYRNVPGRYDMQLFESAVAYLG